MIAGRLRRKKDHSTLLGDVSLTTTAWERMRGLLGRPPLAPGTGLLIDRCRCVHTFGMRGAIDLVYLDTAWAVVKLVRELAPARLSACLAASMTLELAPGANAALALAVGDTLVWETC